MKNEKNSEWKQALARLEEIHQEQPIIHPLPLADSSPIHGLLTTLLLNIEIGDDDDFDAFLASSECVEIIDLLRCYGGVEVERLLRALEIFPDRTDWEGKYAYELVIEAETLIKTRQIADRKARRQKVSAKKQTKRSRTNDQVANRPKKLARNHLQ